MDEPVMELMTPYQTEVLALLDTAVTAGVLGLGLILLVVTIAAVRHL